MITIKQHTLEKNMTSVSDFIYSICPVTLLDTAVLITKTQSLKPTPMCEASQYSRAATSDYIIVLIILYVFH